MQRTWTSRLKLVIKIAIPILVIGLCILFDQLTKSYFKLEFASGGRKDIIKDFFYFTYTVNTGAAWSLFAGKAWAQTFFKVLTGVALVAFTLFIVYSIKKNYQWLTISLALIIGGTIGNFIDRLAFDGVTDFIGFSFGKYNFPIFNLADTFLVVGLIMLIFFYAFLDPNALFKKKKQEENPISNETNEELTQDENCGANVVNEDGNKDISDN